MSQTILDIVRNNPFASPFSHAKCEGLKVNPHREVAALAADVSSGAFIVFYLTENEYLWGYSSELLELISQGHFTGYVG